MCIDTIIFDIGRVLAGYGWEDYLKSITSEPEVYSILEEAIFKNPAWVITAANRFRYPPYCLFQKLYMGKIV